MNSGRSAPDLVGRYETHRGMCEVGTMGGFHWGIWGEAPVRAALPNPNRRITGEKGARLDLFLTN